MIAADFWKNKRVLITGHTGFKGTWLSLWLKQLGANVAGLSLAPAATPNLFDLTRLESEVKSFIGDIRNLSAVKEIVDSFQPEIVFHLAAQALVRQSYKDPVDTYSTNVMGTVNVLEAVRLSGGKVRTTIVVTSDKCYENREWAWGYRENDPMGGHDPYSSSKGCAELVTAAYRRSFFSSGTSALASGRAGNVIGGGDWAVDRLIPDCIRSLEKGEPIAVRNPHSIRPWQHVLEPLYGYRVLAEKLWHDPSAFAAGWNFGPDTSGAKPVSWIADKITKAWGPDARWEKVGDANAPHEASYLKLECSSAHERLGWTPKLGLEDTLTWVVEWYRRTKNGESARTVTLEQIDRYERLQS